MSAFYENLIEPISNLTWETTSREGGNGDWRLLQDKCQEAIPFNKDSKYHIIEEFFEYNSADIELVKKWTPEQQAQLSAGGGYWKDLIEKVQEDKAAEELAKQLAIDKPLQEAADKAAPQTQQTSPPNCETMPIDEMVTNTNCNSLQRGLVKTRCPTDNNLFNSATCKTYCKDYECTVSFQKYCDNNFNNPECKDYCSKIDNKVACLDYIKKFCARDNNIKKDPFCQTTLVKPSMQGHFDLQMDEYCNDEGKQIDLQSVKNNSIDETITKEDTALENPICACYDKGLINAKFSHVTKPYLKTAFASRPQCYYYNCKNDPKAYKKKAEDNCDVYVCNKDLDIIDVKTSSFNIIGNECDENGTPIAPQYNHGEDNPETPNTPQNNTSTSTNTTKIIFIVLIVLIFLFLILMLFLWPKKKDNPNMQYNPPMQKTQYNPYPYNPPMQNIQNTQY